MAYKILGVEPNGIKPQGSRTDDVPAIPQELVPQNLSMLLNEAKSLVLTVLGRQGALTSDIDPAEFHAAIRKRYPVGYYERAPNQEISELDEWHFACRVAERLLRQIEGSPRSLNGGYGSKEQTRLRAHAILEAVKAAARERGIEIR